MEEEEAEEAGAGEAAAEAAPAGQGGAEAGLEEAAVGAAAAVTAEAVHGRDHHPVEVPAAPIIPGSNTDQEAAGPAAAAGRPSGEEASSTPR